MFATLLLYLFIGLVQAKTLSVISPLGHAWRLGFMLLIGSALSAQNAAAGAGVQRERFLVSALDVPDGARAWAEAVPFGRMGLPEDHAGAAVFLASSDSDYVVAQTLNVDGGNWMS